MNRLVRMGFTGDVMLGRKVDERQQSPSRPPKAVWGNLLGHLQRLDGLCINLECCLSTRGRKWTRTNRPFHFRADPDWAVPALTEAGVDYCSLANNHLLDFEGVALLDTLDALSEVAIAHAGAGESLEQALEPARFSVGGLECACMSLTDNTPEFAAGDDSPGVARIEMDVDDKRSRELVDRALESAKTTDPDVLVASLHWGPNMVETPPDAFEEFARWLVDRGVDFIHGHSAHVFQGIEVYDGVPICYDMGDFVDDYAVDRRLRNDRSFLFECFFDESGAARRLELLPVEIYDCAVHEANPDVAAWSRDRMRERSAAFDTSFGREGERLVLTVD